MRKLFMEVVMEESVKKPTKIKRTHTFDRKLLVRLEDAAKKGRRPVSEQLAIFLEGALAKFESEHEPGNRTPAGMSG